MPDYALTVVPIAGTALLAALTGTLRRYGAHLERLSDLAEKVPEGSPARIKLDAAVQAEAARLLAVPRKVRVSRVIAKTLTAVFVVSLLVDFYRFRGATDVVAYKGAGLSIFSAAFLGFMIYHFSIVYGYWRMTRRQSAE